MRSLRVTIASNDSSFFSQIALSIPKNVICGGKSRKTSVEISAPTVIQSRNAPKLMFYAWRPHVSGKSQYNHVLIDPNRAHHDEHFKHKFGYSGVGLPVVMVD